MVVLGAEVQDRRGEEAPTPRSGEASPQVMTQKSTIEVLDKYDLYLENAPLLSCLNPKHERFLLDSFKTRFNDLEPPENRSVWSLLRWPLKAK